MLIRGLDRALDALTPRGCQGTAKEARLLQASHDGEQMIDAVYIVNYEAPLDCPSGPLLVELSLTRS
jgi:hypothetical protein